MENIEAVRRVVAERLGVAEDAFEGLSVCVFPHFAIPHQPYTIGFILDALGVVAQPYSPWKRYDYLVCFEDQTRNVIDVPEFVAKSTSRWLHDQANDTWVEGVSQVGRYINATCNDISKRRVGRVFEEVFGYHLDVDPTTTTGRIVRKSDVNAAHDGSIIVGPISREEYERDREGFVYSVPVNNVDGDSIDDLRVTWCGHVCPMLDRKRRPVTKRFGHGGTGVFIEPVADHFSHGQLAKIAEFCLAFGLDYGELDVLKDRDTGRIYVVDVNKTPNRPFGRMDPDYEIVALTNMAVEFAKGFFIR